MCRLNYHARVTYIQNMPCTEGKSENVIETTLAEAVRLAVAKYRCGDSPAIVGCKVELFGIDSIRAVRQLPDFPKAEDTAD